MLKYARRDGTGQWTQEIVYGVGNTGAAPSIGVTSSGHVVIASQHVASRGLHFATNASGRWVTTLLDTSGTEGGARSLAVGADDSVHVVYFDAAGMRVRYRVRRQPPGLRNDHRQTSEVQGIRWPLPVKHLRRVKVRPPMTDAALHPRAQVSSILDRLAPSARAQRAPHRDAPPGPTDLVPRAARARALLGDSEGVRADIDAIVALHPTAPKMQARYGRCHLPGRADARPSALMRSPPRRQSAHGSNGVGRGSSRTAPSGVTHHARWSLVQTYTTRRQSS